MTMFEVPPTAFAQGAFPAVPAAMPRSFVTADAEASSTIALSALAVGGFATIHAILPTGDDADRDLVLRLVEVGFVPGERVRVIAIGHPGRQPIAVRLSAADSGRRNLSGSTFALRRHEADFIRVVPDESA